MPRRVTYDPWLFVTGGALVLFGLLMVGSASYFVAIERGGSAYYYLLRHLVHLGLGLGVFTAALSTPLRLWSSRWAVLTAVVVSVALLLLVLTMPPIGGARRWLVLGPLRLQPSELAKLAAVLYLARLLSRKEHAIAEPRQVVAPAAVVVGTLTLLIFVEPDLGSAVIVAGTAFVMLFLAGLPWAYIAAAGAAGAAALALAIAMEPYRLQRLRVFLDPGADALGAGFQLNQSLIALGNGGWTGVGLGQGQQKAHFLPAPHTDFIFSVTGEELGLLGTAFVMTAFGILFWRGMRVAVRARDRFAFHLAAGLTTLLVFQGLVHMGVCAGLLPTKGLPLPMVSYGGSSLLMSLAALGLLLNVSQEAS